MIYESLTLEPALGVRFVDALTGRAVPQGLEARLSAGGPPARSWPAVVGPSGLCSWHDLPVAKSWTLRVEDRLGRYLPCTVLVAGSTASLQEILLYAAPTWPVIVEASAILRADLRVYEVHTPVADLAPAAWAKLELLQAGTPVATGYADGAGQALVQVPWRALTFDGASDTLSALHGKLDLRVSWTSREALILDANLPEAKILSTQDSPPSWGEFLQIDLKYGESLTARTVGAPFLIIQKTAT